MEEANAGVRAGARGIASPDVVLQAGADEVGDAVERWAKTPNRSERRSVMALAADGAEERRRLRKLASVQEPTTARPGARPA